MVKFVVDRSPWEFRYKIGFGRREGDTTYVAQLVSMKVLGRHEAMDEYLLEIDEDSISGLMDALWIAGVRPSKALAEKRSEEQLAGEIKWLRETADHLMKKPPKH